MNTQAINTRNNAQDNSKENLKKGAALAGAAAVGAGAVVTADVIRGEEEIELADPIIEAPTSPHVEEVAQADQAQAVQEPTTAPTAEVATPTEVPTTGEAPQGQEEIPATDELPANDDLPTVDDLPTNPDGEQLINNVNSEIDVDDIPDVDPTLVAQNITDDVIMVDPTDIDLENIDIAAVGTVETVDGEVLSAAQFTGENGETLYMVDVNGNGEYDVITDEGGNVLADAPSTLTVSDSQSIVGANEGEYGYLAQDNSDNNDAADLDNPMDDLIDLG